MESSAQSLSVKTVLLKLQSLGNLEEVFENEPDQLQYWYEQLSELDIDAVELERDLALVCQALRLIMTYEHANAEELKDLAEREAAEAAEKEEHWLLERDMLKNQISSLHERITSRAGINDANEAFRDEIDSLTAENAFLKQQARERDREASDQRDRMEELSSKLEQLEREKQQSISNLQQLQLEDSLREMSRRLSSRSDAPQRSEWETRKLRQRNEQALTMSTQLQDLTSQNEKLEEQVENLTTALSEATTLIAESAKRQSELGDELTLADKTVEKLLDEARELKQQLSEREGVLTESMERVDASSKELLSILQNKDAQIEVLKESEQNQARRIEELTTKLSGLAAEGGIEEERIKELEGLRAELVEATRTASKLFEDFSLPADEAGSGRPAIEAQLRIRLLQLDKEADGLRTKLKAVTEERMELERACEQKDMMNARINSENQRIRQMAFGDADSEIRRLESQLKFRDSQIAKLTRMCSLLQVELHEEGKGEGELKNAQRGSQKPNSKKVTLLVPGIERAVMTENGDFIVHEEGEKKEGEVKWAKDEHESGPSEELRESSSTQAEEAERRAGLMQPLYFIKPQTREELEANALLINSLYSELRNLIMELENSQKEVNAERVLRSNTQEQLLTAKLKEANAKDELAGLRASLFADNTTTTSTEEVVVSRLEALEIECMELKRMEENLGKTGTEKERRIAESTRRLIYLAIENAQLTRRFDAGKRIRVAMAEENSRLNARLKRLSAGDEARGRQLMAENEINLIEIARLQHMLLHSVPLSEYDRLLKEHKYLLAKQMFGTHPAPVDKEEEELYDRRFDISKSAMHLVITNEQRSADILLKRNVRLNELNEILEEQNLAWKAESQRLNAEISELQSFLDDIESHSDLKSLIVNIERRFVHAIKEQFDSVETSAATEREVARLNEQLRHSRLVWRKERSQLVNVIIQMARQNRHLHDMTPPLGVDIQQLMAFKRTMCSVEEREALVEKKLQELTENENKLEERKTTVEASQASIQVLLDSDFQLAHIQTSLQGYQLTVITLTGELNAAKKELLKYKHISDEMATELHELKAELMQFHFSNAELSLWHRDLLEELGVEERHLDNGGKQEELGGREMQKKDKSRIDAQVLHEVEEESISSRTDSSDEVIVRPTKGGEELSRAALEMLMQNFRDQLNAKDKCIEEYRELVEALQLHLQYMQEAKLPGAGNIEAASPEERPRSSEELVGIDKQLEEKEREAHAMELQVHELAEANSSLVDQLQKLLVKEQERDAKRSMTFSVGVQVGTSQGRQATLPTASLLPNSQETDAKDEGVEKKDSAESDVSDGSGSDEEETDSGTVDDMEETPKASRRASSRASSAGSEAGVKVLPTHTGAKARSVGSVGTSDAAESMIFKHRGEVRRLRMRITELERRNKQVTEENLALRERSRRYAVPRQTAEQGGESRPLATKENERLQRENKNLAKSLQSKMEELETLQTQLKKQEGIAKGKASIGNWEERKRLEHMATTLKAKLVESKSREAELKERLERREKHMEQMNRNQASRYVDVEKFNKMAKEWRDEKSAWKEREGTLRNEMRTWSERYKDAIFRLNTLAKENRLLYGQMDRLHGEKKTPQGIAIGVQVEIEPERRRMLPAPPPMPKAVPVQSRVVVDNDRQLRRSELLLQETREELTALRLDHEKLLSDYNQLLRFRPNERAACDEKNGKIASVELLRDKLAAKDNEIAQQGKEGGGMQDRPVVTGYRLFDKEGLAKFLKEAAEERKAQQKVYDEKGKKPKQVNHFGVAVKHWKELSEKKKAKYKEKAKRMK